MKRMRIFFSLLALVSLLIVVGNATAQEGPSTPTAPLGTGITYQGRLVDNDTPAAGNFDFLFLLYDSSLGGAQVGGTVAVNDLPVSDGYFTVYPDFGATVFNGQARWLEVQVRPGASTGTYTVLSPRQALSAAPYALYSLTAPWSGIGGMPAGFADGVDNDTTYSAGQGITLSGSTFSLNTTFTDGRYWSLTGNSGTNPTSQYLGTSDNTAFELRVNSARALRLEPNLDGPNLIGGYSGNFVTSGVFGATVFGGGIVSGAEYNMVTDNFGTVSGGGENKAGNGTGGAGDAEFATVSGGEINIASARHATVSGGAQNTAFEPLATVGGGFNNNAGYSATVNGGIHNTASGEESTIGGGSNNTASQDGATVGGGQLNSANGINSTVSGGFNNVADGIRAFVPGGYFSHASGNYTFAAGTRAKAIYDGSYVWADGNDFDFSSQLNNQFSARATGGFRLATGIDSNGNVTWRCSMVNGESWACTSDRNMKENFQAVDSQAILEKLSQVPILYWNAKGADPNVKHLGPMAQDFFAAFNLGNSDTAISTIDLDGVALAAIQGLNQRSLEQGEQITGLQAANAVLTAENEALKTQLSDIEARLSALERGIAPQTARPSAWSYLPYLGLAALGIGLVWQMRVKRGGQ